MANLSIVGDKLLCSVPFLCPYPASKIRVFLVLIFRVRVRVRVRVIVSLVCTRVPQEESFFYLLFTMQFNGSA